MSVSWAKCGLLSLTLWCILGLSLAEDCSSQRAQQCRSAVEDELQRETSNSPLGTRRTTATNHRQEMMIHCRSLADNLNCLVWQTSNCLSLEDRERNSEPIYKAWKYMSSVCDAVVGWKISQCFQRDDLRRCESLNRETSRSTSRDNCDKFVSFKECVESIVKYQCPVEDQTLVSLYMLDMGREKAWKCSSTEGTRHIDNYQYQPVTYAGNGDAQDAICLARSSGNIRACSDHYYQRQDEARRNKDSQDRMHRECCASLEFERCVRDTVRDYCTQVRDSVVQTILDQNGVRQDPRCRYYGDNECNAAASVVISLFLTFIMVVYSSGRGKLFH